MAVTQEQIDALNQAIADGVRSVTIRGVTTTYNTTDSLIRARDNLQEVYNRQQAAAMGAKGGTRTLLHHAGRGYNGPEC